jgi:hypothetical protein
MIERFIQYLRKLTLGDSKESSKRFMALCTMVLVSYLVFRYTDPANCTIILGELLSFILVLVGVASWQNIRQIEEKNKDENEDLLDNT